MTTYREFYRRSIDDREAFWAEQAHLVDWHTPVRQVLDYSRPPFARWFVGGETNLCFNAVDRHLSARGDQTAIAWISTEVEQERRLTNRELFAEVNRCAAMLALYVPCSLAIWLAFRLVANFINRLQLKEFDRQLGAVLCRILILFYLYLLFF